MPTIIEVHEQEAYDKLEREEQRPTFFILVGPDPLRQSYNPVEEN